MLVCATRGEAGEDSTGAGRRTEELGAVREQELRAAAAAIGVAEVEVLGFFDSGWAGPAPVNALVHAGEAAVRAVHEALVRHRSRVVVTLDPSGSDGHRDHAAIGAATTAALARYGGASSLYYWCLPQSLMDRWVAARGGEAGVYADPRLGRPDADITTVIDERAVLEIRRQAIAAHASQSSPFLGLPPELEAAFLMGTTWSGWRHRGEAARSSAPLRGSLRRLEPPVPILAGLVHCPWRQNGGTTLLIGTPVVDGLATRSSGRRGALGPLATEPV